MKGSEEKMQAKSYERKELGLTKSQYKKYQGYMKVKGVGSALAISGARGHKPALNLIKPKDTKRILK